MKKLVVVDMQNDFIDGSLGTNEAVAIVDNVKDKIGLYNPSDVYVTLDTHGPNYLNTQEGEKLPVEHCIKGTDGWKLSPAIEEMLQDAHVFEKPTFGSVALAEELKSLAGDDYPDGEGMEIELVGLCTDICVVSNALLIKAYLPEARISVDPSCCAGVTPESHEAALATMRMCQIEC
jgi:nicotinamidase-related amidase